MTDLLPTVAIDLQNCDPAMHVMIVLYLMHSYLVSFPFRLMPLFNLTHLPIPGIKREKLPDKQENSQLNLLLKVYFHVVLWCEMHRMAEAAFAITWMFLKVLDKHY